MYYHSSPFPSHLGLISRPHFIRLCHHHHHHRHLTATGLLCGIRFTPLTHLHANYNLCMSSSSSSIRFFSSTKSRASLNDIHNPIICLKRFRPKESFIKDYTINQEFNNNILYVYLPPLRSIFELNNDLLYRPLLLECLTCLLESLSNDYDYNLQFNCLIYSRMSTIKPKHSDLIYRGLSKYSTMKLRIILFIEKHLGYYTGFSAILSYCYIPIEYHPRITIFYCVSHVVNVLYNIIYDIDHKPIIHNPEFGILLIVKRDIKKKDNTTITKLLDFVFRKQNLRYRGSTS